MTSGIPGRPLARSMRVWFVIDTLLIIGAGFQLIVLASSTDRFFAWTIEPAVSAAFIGAGYWAAIPMIVLAARQYEWVHARIAVFGVWLFTALTLIVTLIHLDRFNFDAPDLTARVGAWIWLVVYIIVTIGLPVLVLVQWRVPGGERPRGMTLPTGYRWVLGVLAGLAGATGVVLYVAPGTLTWPWPLTPLSSQALGAWLIGIAVIIGQLAWENDWKRVRIALYALIALGVLYLVLLLAYSSSVDWGNPFATGLAAFAVAVLAAGAWGLVRARRAASILTFAG